MNEGRDRAAWSVVSEILAVMANLWTSSKGRRWTGGDFNPYRIHETAMAPIDMLRQVFVERSAG